MASKKKSWKAEWEQTVKKVKKMAKRANQRMVRLERYSLRSGLSAILSYAYGKTANYIEKNQGLGPSGKPRFKENIKLYDINDGIRNLKGDELYRANVMLQRQRLKKIEEFLAADTSTLGRSRSGEPTQGIKAVMDKRTETINRKLREQYGAGYEFTDAELKQFFDSKKQAKLEQMVGSDLMFIVAAVIKKENLKSNKRDLEKFVLSHLTIDKTGLSEQEIINRFKSRKGESYKDYLNWVEPFVDYTGDEVLDHMVTKALQAGINVNNIFIS